MFSSDPPQSVTPLRRHRKLLKKPEGGAVWPENVERAFLLGLRLYRWELTRSVTWHRGSQNQFLVDYLHRLQINRDNKQVASHLQFLRSTYMGTAQYHLVAGEKKRSCTPALGSNVDEQQGLASVYRDRYIICVGCREEQRNLSDSLLEGNVGTTKYFCSLACKYADWRPHEGFWVSDDFWDYPRRPFLPFNDLDCSAALRCQLALIDSDPDVLYHLAPNTDNALRFQIIDAKQNVSFRRVRDTAIVARDSECIAILAQALVAAIEIQESNADLGQRIDAVYRQLEEEYGVRGIGSMVLSLLQEYGIDSSSRSATLQWFHALNMAKRG
ncbi:hypothetical protein B0H14DRAFT_3865237 [Mycena olivaceomarginata]|nr:hypothetical protein B0H14DRAFT_3865237 [Mycena olivaceomarginata]